MNPNQLHLDEPRARRTDPGTSHRAARSVKDIAESQRRILEILWAAEQHGREGLTDAGIAACWETWWVIPYSASGLRTRRSELVRQGLVWNTGTTATLPSGREAIVWAISEKGRQALNDRD